ncbi:bifunctional proline dehydrogenase/L-glutamate gamma-semialdehyde dehydrogenase [Brevibacterium sp. 91QC2O2]|uniref:bifunctional proline dehydrogenase/L-glutamate gamma-semialdehyde dehydrogenase n=1 Tax=Brevibacterium sp. 91QC2O2 TaxID=2968458 RepID=UPI00211C147A|nr:bifunctional proline dehydrogenase/L-glutamate gamma-semialdehyde dehydrogenase [Brevibacterium sp. 91QC2O2]MCQ9368339.1 bifunctional proline dehydrogenase/L-glutamate gamma-semialdehyde dehydrogenase [Brevibacterium sp. 91QC2O2]
MTHTTETTPANPTTALADLSAAAIARVRRWLRMSSAQAQPDPAAARLAAVLQDPTGLDFTVGFVDRVIRTEDTRAAGRALKEVAALAPASLPALDRAQIRAGAALAEIAPDVVVPIARNRLRSMVGHMVVDARERQLGCTLAKIHEQGHRLNINLLGEAVLGEDEADHHLAETHRLVAREDVDYVSIKVSSIASQLNMWAYDDTIEYVLDRLRPLYREAAAAPAGKKFINLDMEEYRDLELTIAVFTRLLDEPELKQLEAGIVLQAYLPDALGAMQRLSDFASKRVAAGGAGIKVRLVKGANLAMERVAAETHDWPLTTNPSKQATDANYKRVLYWLFTRERMAGLRIGVAGHNLFDIAFAHELSLARGVADRVEFEMLQGMAREQSDVVSQDVGQLLLYVPAVKPAEFDVAISYLVRRLEENSASENFMSGIFELANGNEMFDRECTRFRSAVDDLATLLDAHGETAPPANRRQDRSAEAAAGPRELSAQEVESRLADFVNEPDTDPSLPANQRWTAEAIASSAAQDFAPAGATATPLASSADVDELVGRGRAAAADWSALGARGRGEVLLRAAEVFGARRGEFLAVMAAEAGKTPAQADPEVSEAIDFIRYYAHRAVELEELQARDGVTFAPDRLVLVTPPWNFPVAIPTGSTVAALAVGAAAVHKPSMPTPRCSALIIECLHQAGVPTDVLQLVAPVEGEIGQALVAHPGVDRVILTGASDTAALFRSFNPELAINAETSGKNALIVTPSADRDLAVADLVTSAFGHAGQKCSAASLAIMVGPVYKSERFRRQLVDAVSSLVVDYPADLRSVVGPLTEDPSDKLRRALTALEPGESWLVEPKQLDDTGRLWSPGVKDGVKPGSFFHLTECFGPVLGLMDARSLDEAIELQNAVDYGLTAGIHSLDTSEVGTWLDRVQAGNLYVNRGITGAIVRRQPFGGWKKSSVGLGSKAGGPNYLMLFGSWADGESGAQDSAGQAASWLAAAAASDCDAWVTEFGVGHDPAGLRSEANLFRYVPRAVTLRVGADASAAAVARSVHAGGVAGAPVGVVADPAAKEVVAAAAELLKGEGLAGEAARAAAAMLGSARFQGAEEFAKALVAGTYDDTVGARVRVLGRVEPGLYEAVTGRPEVALITDDATVSGRVELRYYLSEQAISMTLHRFGNPSPDFHRLADALSPNRRK